jgi:protein-tyrosine phosphatase
MIDLRCHLFDESDGFSPHSIETVELCRQAFEDGVHTSVVTLRWSAAAADPPLSFVEYEQRLARLQSEVGPSHQLKLGFLFRFREDLAELVERHGESVTLGGGRSVLVALPAMEIPRGVEETWANLTRLGFSAIVAGPECSPQLRRHQDRIEKWIDNGVRLQLNAASITGAHGREAQRFAAHCIREFPNRVVVASNTRVGDARRPSLAFARNIVTRQFGRACARSLFEVTPADILKNSSAALCAEPRGRSRLLSQILKLKKAVTDTA